MDRETALKIAKAAVCDRPNQYGKPEDNFQSIADIWTAIDGGKRREPYTAVDVALFQIGVKIARILHDPQHADSWVDLSGYGACGAEVAKCRPLHPYSITENDE